jgi:hypothetical protein
MKSQSTRLSKMPKSAPPCPRPVGSSLGGISASAVIAIGALWFLDNWLLAFVLFAGLTWLTLALATARSPEERWTPPRLFVPVLATYSGSSLAISRSQTISVEALCIVLSVIGFLIGYAVMVANSDKTDYAPRGESDGVRRGFIYLAFTAALLTYVYLVARAGRPPSFAEDSNLARTLFFPNGVTSSIVVVGFQTVLVAGLCSKLLRIRDRLPLTTLALAIISALLLATLGNRGMLIAPMLVVLLVAVWKKRFPIGRFLVLGVVGLFAFSYAGYERNISAFGHTYLHDLERAGFVGGAQILAPFLNYLAGTSETFSRTMSIVPSSTPFQGGLQFFGPVLLQPSADLFLKDQLGLTFTGFGLAIGFTNAFYLDWGIVGCCLGPLVLGGFIALFFRKGGMTGEAGIVIAAYILVRLLLSSYGHPFAYLYYIVLPVFIYVALGGRWRSHPPRNGPEVLNSVNVSKSLRP